MFDRSVGQDNCEDNKKETHEKGSEEAFHGDRATFFLFVVHCRRLGKEILFCKVRVREAR